MYIQEKSEMDDFKRKKPDQLFIPKNGLQGVVKFPLVAWFGVVSIKIINIPRKKKNRFDVNN